MNSNPRPASVWLSLLLLLIGAGAPWLAGPWAAGRFPALCVLPGTALLLALGHRTWQQPARAFAAAILASAVLTPITFFLFLRVYENPGSAGIATGLAWGLLAAVAFLRGRHRLRLPSLRGSSWRDLLWILGASALISLPLFLNRDLRLRSDAWTHIALVREILQRPYPWTDPRFAGEPLRYFWFYNLWAAAFSARGGLGIPEALAWTNFAGLLATVATTLAVAQRFTTSRAGRIAALGVAYAGLNPLGLLLFPLKIASALVGAHRGAEALAPLIARDRFLSFHVTDTLTPYATSFVAWMDKYLVPTAFGLGMGAAAFLALVIWEGARGKRLSAEQLLLGGIGMAALLLHHVVAAAFTGFVLAGALFATKSIRRLALSWRSLWILCAVWAGIALAVAPYLASILLGGDSGGGDAYGLGLETVWILTAATAIGPLVAFLALGRGELALSLRRGRTAFLAFVALSLLLIAVIRMPTVNENKMIILFFCLAAPFGGAGALRLQAWMSRRVFGRVVWWALLIGSGLVPAMTWFGELQHREPRTSPDVSAAAEWIRQQTPNDAVVIEPPGRRLLLNLAERDMFVSEFEFVLQCGYPRDEMEARTRLVDRLYCTGGLESAQEALLTGFERPVYLFCENAGTGRPSPSGRLFEPVFRSGRTEVYRWAPRQEQPRLND